SGAKLVAAQPHAALGCAFHPCGADVRRDATRAHLLGDRLRQRAQPRKPRAARAAAEVMLLDRSLAIGVELTELVSGELAELDRVSAALRHRVTSSRRSSSALRRARARWRTTRTCPGSIPSDSAISTALASSKNVRTIT